MVLERGLPNRNVTISPEDIDAARANNQFILTGTDVQFPEPEENAAGYIAFIEYVEASAAYTISTNETVPKVIIPSRTGALVFDHSCVRFDNGFKMTGPNCFVKGFFVRKHQGS